MYGDEGRPLSADALRLLDRARPQSAVGRAAKIAMPTGGERKSARYSHVKRWTQPLSPPASSPGGEALPLLSSAAGGAHGTRGVHSVPDDSMVPARRAPLSGVLEMVSASTALSKESEQILAVHTFSKVLFLGSFLFKYTITLTSQNLCQDRSVTMAVACASWVLMLQGLAGLHGLALYIYIYIYIYILYVYHHTQTYEHIFMCVYWVICVHIYIYI